MESIKFTCLADNLCTPKISRGGNGSSSVLICPYKYFCFDSIVDFQFIYHIKPHVTFTLKTKKYCIQIQTENLSSYIESKRSCASCVLANHTQ